MKQQAIGFILFTVLQFFVFSKKDVAQEHIPFIFMGNLMVLDVTIEDQPRKMVLDMGAMVNVIPENWVSIKPKMRTRKMKDAMMEKSYIDITKELNLSLGSLAISGTRSMLIDSLRASSMFGSLCCKEEFGILGMEYFIMQSKALKIDMQSKELLVYKDKLEQEPEASTVLKMKYKLPFPIPMFTVKLGASQKVDLHFDTGFSGFMMIKSEEIAPPGNYKCDTMLRYFSAFSTSGIDTVKRYYDIPIGMGKSWNAYYPYADIAEGKINLAGMEFLRSFSQICLDFKRGKFYFSEVVNPLPTDSFQFLLAPRDGKYYVQGKVLKPETAYLKIGHELHSVNGYDLSQIRLDSCCHSRVLDSLERVKIERLE